MGGPNHRSYVLDRVLSWTGPGPASSVILSSTKIIIPSTRISSAGIFGADPARRPEGPWSAFGNAASEGPWSIGDPADHDHGFPAPGISFECKIASPQRLLPSVTGEKVDGGTPWPCLCNVTIIVVADKSLVHTDQIVLLVGTCGIHAAYIAHYSSSALYNARLYIARSTHYICGIT
jgi:hypothetical protein